MGKVYLLREHKESYQVRPVPRKKIGGFTLVDGEFSRRWMKLLGNTVSCVYLTLCSMAGKDQCCFPSMKTIRERVGCSHATIARSIRLLEHYQLISIGKRKFKVNKYVLNDKSAWVWPSEENGYARPGEFIMLPR